MNISTLSRCLLAMAAATASAADLRAQCTGNDGCEFTADPGSISIQGPTEKDDDGYWIVNVDENGNVEDFRLQFENKSNPKCKVYQSAEGEGTIYWTDVSLCSDDSASNFDYTWYAEPYLEGGLTSGFVQTIDTVGLYDGGKSIEIIGESDSGQPLFPYGGLWKITRAFHSDKCVVGCENNEASKIIHVIKPPPPSNARISFTLPEDNAASADAAATQEWMDTWQTPSPGGNCKSIWSDEAPVTNAYFHCSSFVIPGIQVHGTLDFCGLTESHFQKLGPEDSDWVTFLTNRTSLSGSHVADILPSAGESVQIRRQDYIDDVVGYTNVLTIQMAPTIPNVRVEPTLQERCESDTWDFFQPHLFFESDYPVTRQWQQLNQVTTSEGVIDRWDDIAGETSIIFQPTPTRTTEYRLLTYLDDRDPRYVCLGDGVIISNTVEARLTASASEYKRDSDGDGYPDPNSDSQDYCNPPDGWVLASREADCDDTDPDKKPFQSWYRDEDRDGLPRSFNVRIACEPPSNRWVPADEITIWALDCDDLNDQVTFQTAYYLDNDGDGYPASRVVTRACSRPSSQHKPLEELVSEEVDCDDNDASLHPDAAWLRDDDNDGYGDSSEEILGCSAPEGFFLVSRLLGVDDCNDDDREFHQIETWYRDDDGDGFPSARTNFPDQVRTRQSCGPINNFTKREADLISLEVDCDDTDPEAHPQVLWFPDADNDGLGDSFAEGTPSCQSLAPDFVTNRLDCDDDDTSPCIPDALVGQAFRPGSAPESLAEAYSPDPAVGNFGFSDFTVELWFRSETTDDAVLISKGIPTGDSEDIPWAIGILGGRLVALSQNDESGNDQPLWAESPVNDGVWHHLAYRRLGQHFSLWIDGVKEAEEVINYEYDLTGRLGISVLWDFTPGGERPPMRYQGEVDEIRLWGRGLTAQEMSRGRHLTLGGDEPGLETYWQFNEIVETADKRLVVDVIRAHHLEIWDGALTSSTAPVGTGGAIYSEYVPELPGTGLEFEGVNVAIENPSTTAEYVSVVATEVSGAPEGELPTGEQAGAAYWVLDILNEGEGQETAGDFVATVKGQGPPQEGAAVLTDDLNSLYWRSFNGSGEWNLLSQVQGPTRSTVTFPDISIRSGQYLIMTIVGDPIPGTPFKRGDCNTDDLVDISDAISTLTVLFLGQGEFHCEKACDSNDDSLIDISDAINSLNALFIGQGAIPSPGIDACGLDPTDDGLSCERYVPCGA